MRSKSIASWSLGILLAIGIGILLATGIRSGVLFQLDRDEFVHAQFSYLLLHGIIPYRQFFMTYTPIFDWFITPIFIRVGYTMSAMSLVRWLMVAIFLLRIVASGWIVLRIFGKRVAALFIFLFLMDPFTMYTSMQIRPDNLMMLLFTAGIAFLVYALAKHKFGYFFWSGMLLATSGLVLIKIAPSLVVIWVAILLYGHTRQYYPSVKVFSLGFVLPVVIFFLFTTFMGNTNEMLQQVIKDSYAINQSQAFPIPIKHFLESNNPGLYDLYGEAWTRLPYFEQAMLALAAVGLLLVLCTKLKRLHASQPDASIVAYILAGSLIVQVASLTVVHSMNIQYFLPLTWLVDVFVAIAVMQFARVLAQWKILYAVGIIELIIFLSLGFYDSTKANISRSRSTTNASTEWITTMWARVPENVTAYPNIPFRPLAYPLTFGYYFVDLPPSVISHLPPLVSTLEKNHVQYILQTYDWKAQPQDFFPYISEKYHQIDSDVYIRNE